MAVEVAVPRMIASAIGRWRPPPVNSNLAHAWSFFWDTRACRSAIAGGPAAREVSSPTWIGT